MRTTLAAEIGWPVWASTTVPLIVAEPGGPSGTCATPVSLLDVSETIISHFGATLEGSRPGRPLYDIAAEPEDPDRVIFSEYHAVGAVSAAYMLRKGDWKIIKYDVLDGTVRETQLFNVAENPDEFLPQHQDPKTVQMTGRKPTPQQTNLADMA